MAIDISPELIENILLCDPITYRGKEKLCKLGLETEITPSVFWGTNEVPGIWVDPNKIKDYTYNEIDPSDIILQYPDSFELDDINRRKEDFDNCFNGNSGVSLLALKGVVGSGKTIAMHHQIFQNYNAAPFQSNGFVQNTPNAILVDLERTVEYIFDYRCADPEQPIHLFLTSILETLLYYIWELVSKHTDQAIKSSFNYNRLFCPRNLPVNQDDPFFGDVLKNISLWAKAYKKADNNDIRWQQISKSIIRHLRTKPQKDRDVTEFSAQEDIGDVLWLLFLLSYCTFPDDKKLFVVDNIEDYIAVRTPGEQEVHIGVPVSNSQIKLIYSTLYQFKDKIKSLFERYKKHVNKPIMDSVTVGMAVRRTTFQLLSTLYYGTIDSQYDDIFDITGDLTIETLWETKYNHIWRGYLKNKIGADNPISKYLHFANGIILEGVIEGDRAHGTPYPERMMRMLSRGIRRTGHNISMSLYSVYRLLTSSTAPNKKRNYIDYDQFDRIFSEHKAARGMLRQALIEYYYRCQLFHTHKKEDRIGDRWSRLNIGELGDTADVYLFDCSGKNNTNMPMVKANKVVYSDGAVKPRDKKLSYRSMLCRVLGVLSEKKGSSASACIAPEFVEIPIGDLLHELFPYEPASDELHYLAKVLIAASTPERKGDYTPLALMALEVHAENKRKKGPDSFASFLLALWKEKNGESIKDEYRDVNPENNKIRITEGGVDFLHQWQGSFTYFSALCCYNYAPLFFVNSKVIIYNTLFSVYNHAQMQRDFYRSEATRFATKAKYGINEKKLRDSNLCIVNGERQSFDKRMRQLHINYLATYKAYITECYSLMGISEADKIDIIHAIDRVRQKFDFSEWVNQVPCF